MSELEVAVRNPGLVLLWSFGLFMLMHLHQYLGGALAAWRSEQTLDAIMSGKYQDHNTILMRGLAAAAIGLPLALVATTVLWRRPIGWMQLDFRWNMLLAGLAMGLVLPILIVLFLRAIGLASVYKSLSRLQWDERLAAHIGVACTAVFTGIAEEIVFRGMAARELAHVWGWPLAVLVAGAFFGIVHLASRFKTLTVRSALVIMVSSVAVSFLFVAMYVRSGSLWLPIGFHAAWNYSLVEILGLPMSGRETDGGLAETRLDTSSWLTGGSVGMEASPVALAAYVLVGLLYVVF